MCGEDKSILNFSACADYLLVLVKSQSRKSLETRSECVMNLVTERRNSTDVTVPPENTITMLLNGSLSSNRPPVIRVNVASYRCQAEVDYFGISMNDKDKLAPISKTLRGNLPLISKI